MWGAFRNWPLYGQAENVDLEEKLSLEQRFADEGLAPHLPSDRKLIHVWRWLQDAESNCISLRKQMEKAHKQQEHDIKEVEVYVEHVWSVASEKIKSLEDENEKLKKQIKELGGKQSHIPTSDNLSDSVKLKTGLRDFFRTGKKPKLSNSESPAKHDLNTINLNHISRRFSESQETDNELKALRNAKYNLELENETLTDKLYEVTTQRERLEDKLRAMQTNGDEASEENKALLESKLKEATLVKRLEFEIEQLRAVVRDKEESCQELLRKYERRKAQHRERIDRLRVHVERETARWQQLFQEANARKRAALQQLERQSQTSKAVSLHSPR